jgi:crossover junction endodeoxyribonuclease RuvC
MSGARILGVDPGQSGGLAIIHGGQLVRGTRMPIIKIRGKAQLDARAVIEWWADTAFDVAVIEAVHAMPRQGVTSSFQFGRMLGAIESLVFTVGMPVHYVTPASWKKAMGLSSDKQQSIDAAKLRFGSAADALLKHKADDGIAEAALIAAHWASQQ